MDEVLQGSDDRYDLHDDEDGETYVPVGPLAVLCALIVMVLAVAYFHAL
ncbi:hypothetical protein G3I40_40710 [Streptomyces sp. SID14478]|nr:hypothetical protein [Streptomyces sp. SID14478]NEB81490.1 hypothetical protein [Streptomyces sp. SID14478]